MRLTKSKNANENYLSKIVNIQKFRQHLDPEVNRLKCCSVDGFNIITGMDSEPGLYVYFPSLSCINSDFLRYNNLYRDSTKNKDTTKSGMFESNGKVKPIKLRGEISEGFILPIQELQNYVVSVAGKEIEIIDEGLEFDSIEHNGKSFWVSKKYVSKAEQVVSLKDKPVKKVSKKFDKIIISQFRFHYNTTLIKKVPYIVKYNDIIHISSKWHGTSGISSYVICKQPLNWKQKIAKWLTGEQFNKYDYIYSSRSVIKNKYYNKDVSSGYYECDVWAEADKIVKPCLTKGITAYYEIVGYLPSGSYIQKNYDYGCVPPTNDEYISEKNFKVRIYRVTYTDVDGNVYEFTPKQVRWWCDAVGLIPVSEFYYGYAKDLYPDIELNENWNDNFIDRMSNDSNFYMEKNSPDCNNKVPHEGVVIKIDDGQSRAFKLKCFNFINKIDNSDEVNIEDNN